MNPLHWLKDRQRGRLDTAPTDESEKARIRSNIERNARELDRLKLLEYEIAAYQPRRAEPSR